MSDDLRCPKCGSDEFYLQTEYGEYDIIQTYYECYDCGYILDEKEEALLIAKEEETRLLEEANRLGDMK